jgi:pentatricopeptide repeat protein
MISVYLAQGKTTEAQALLNQILDLGLTTRADAVNTFLTAMLSRPEKNVHTEVLGFLEDLQRTRGFKPDAVTYHIILSYWLGIYEKHIVRGDDPKNVEISKSASDAFMATSAAMLQDTHISIPDYIFATLIRFAAAMRDLSQFEAVHREMQRRRIPTTILISNTFMDFWVQYPEDRGVDVHAKLNSIVADLKRFKLKPTTITYNILLGFYASKNNMVAVTKLFTEIVEANLRPDSTTYSIVLEALRDHPTQAQTVIADVEASGVVFDEKLYSALLKSHNILPTSKLERYLKQVLDRGVRPNIPSDELSEIAEKILYGYIMRAHHILGRPLFDEPAAPAEVDDTAALEEKEESSGKLKTKKKKSLKKKAKKSKKKAAAAEVEEDDDDFEFNEEELSEEDLIDDEELKALEGNNTPVQTASKEQIREQLTIAQNRAMSLYTRLRTYGIGLGPRFYKSMIPLFRNELPKCLAIAQDVFQRTHKKRTHFVLAQLILPVVKEETVLFDSEIHQWNQKLQQIALASPNPAYPIMDSESKIAFAAFLDKVHASLKPSESASYSATFDKLETQL